jgi:hypothetical protein
MSAMTDALREPGNWSWLEKKDKMIMDRALAGEMLRNAISSSEQRQSHMLNEMFVD